MDAKNQQAIYQLGAVWGKSHLQQLTPLADDYDRFKAWMAKVTDGDDFVLETLQIPVRLFNQYKRYPDEAHSAFMAGVWDALHGSTDGLSAPPTL